MNPSLKYDDVVIGGPVTYVNISSKSSTQWFGRVDASSDTLGFSAVVSTYLIGSASLVAFWLQNNWVSGSSAVSVPWAVNCISPALPGGTAGGFFRIGTVASCACVGSWTVMYRIDNPQKIARSS